MKIRLSSISLAYALLTLFAFAVALLLALSLHHSLVLGNHCDRTGETEWLPSLSAVIGDHYPERALFRYLMSSACFLRTLQTLGHRELFRPLKRAADGEFWRHGACARTCTLLHVRQVLSAACGQCCLSSTVRGSLPPAAGFS